MTATAVATRGFREPGIKIADGVHAIGASRNGQFKGGYSRAYLFENDDGLTLVDTLWEDDAYLILEYLWSICRTPRDITDIVMTHSHRSHLGGLKTLKELSGATVHSHPLEAPIIEGKASAAKIPLWPLRPPQLIGFRVASQLGLFPHAPCTVDDPHLVEHTTEIGGLKVMHLPGHTPGNIGLSWHADSVLAIADTIMTWPSFSAGWPGFNTDDDEFRRSLKHVVELKPEVVCVGHGDPIWENAAEAIETLL